MKLSNTTSNEDRSADRISDLSQFVNDVENILQALVRLDEEVDSLRENLKDRDNEIADLKRQLEENQS